MDRAVTVGCEMNLSLKTPCEVFEANAGFKREVTVNNSQVRSDKPPSCVFVLGNHSAQRLILMRLPKTMLQWGLTDRTVFTWTVIYSTVNVCRSRSKNS